MAVKWHNRKTLLMYLPKLWRYKSPHFFHMFRRPCIETNRVVPSIWQQTRIRSWFSLNGFITYYTVQLTATVIFTPSLLSFVKSFQSSEFFGGFNSEIRCSFFRFESDTVWTKFFKGCMKTSSYFHIFRSNEQVSNVSVS